MEKLSISKDVAESKLLILYILGKLDMAVGSIDLIDYVLGERLLDFITFQQRIHELIVTNHINSFSESGKTLYLITDSGAGLISEMTDLLPLTEKRRVDRTITKLGRRAINSRSITAEYIPEDERSGAVHIRMNEGDFNILSLEIATASKEEARAICANWKTNAAEVYTGIVGLLLGKRDARDTRVVGGAKGAGNAKSSKGAGNARRAKKPPGAESRRVRGMRRSCKARKSRRIRTSRRVRRTHGTQKI